MNIEQALNKLRQYDITSSEQVLRRWIRQGKIDATIRTKKEGYQVDRDSLNAFINSRRTFTLEEVERMLHKERMKVNYDYKTWEKTFHKNRQLKDEVKKLEEENKDLKHEVNYYKNKALNDMEDYIFNDTGGNNKTLFGDEKTTKRTFRKILSKLHPDAGGDEQTFKQVNEVYANAFKS